MDVHLARATQGNSAGNDSSFGPRYGNTPDVTLTFTNIVFTILPSCLLLVAAVGHVWFYSQRRVVAVRSPILWAKMATSICILALSVASSVAWCTNAAYSTPTSVPAAVLFSLAATAMPALIWVEHCKTTQSSSVLLSFYLTIAMLLDAAHARSFTMRPGLETAGALTGTAAALKFTLAVLLEVRKSLTSELEAKSLTGELTSGFWSRCVMAWLNALLIVGYRKRLGMSDLRNLDETFSAQYLDDQFVQVWNKTPRGENALIRVFARLFGAELLLACAPRLTMLACYFANVYLMRAILAYLASPNSAESFTRGGLLAATALSYLSVMITRSATTAITNRAAVRIRSTAFAQVTKKVMRLPISAAEKSTALSHISADAEGILLAVNTIPNALTAPFYMGAAIYALYLVVGKVVSLAAIPCIIYVAFTTALTRYVPGAQRRWNSGIDSRIASSTLVLSQLRSIKIIGLTPSMEHHLQSMRQQEMNMSLQRRGLSCLNWVFSPIQIIGLPLAMVGGLIFWTRQQHVLDATTIYSMMCFAYMVSDALKENRISWPQIAGMFALFARIQEFLLQDERPNRGFADAQDEEKSALVMEKHNSDLAISVSDVSVAGRENHAHQVLSGVHLKVAKASFTILIGAVGSGKSVFLKTVLRETALVSGTVAVNVASVAWCGQLPWISRGTIRGAILGESAFEETWYRTVVKACALEHDFARLPEGDKSPTGTNGSSLSGGQMRRLGLARAVYSKASLLLCDDVLSALDKNTAAHIFREVFSSHGLLRKHNRTVVLASHSIEWLADADQIVVFEDGRARACEQAEITVDMQQIILAQGSNAGDESDMDGISTANEEAEPEQWNDRMSTDWSLYGFYFRSAPWYLLWSSVVGVLLIGFFERFPEVYFRIWLSVGPANHLFYIGLVCILFAMVIVSFGAIYLYWIRTVCLTGLNVHNAFVDTLMRATLPFITSTNSGALLNKFSQDMSLIAQTLPNELVMVIYIGQLTFILTVLVAAGAQYAALMVPGIIIAIYFLQLFYLQSSRQMRLLDLESQTPLYTKISESTAGLEYIRAFGWEEQVLREIFDFTDEAAKPFYYMYTIQRWLVLVLNGIGLIMSVILISMAVYVTETSSQAGLGLALTSLIDYSEMVESLVVNWTGLETSLGAVRRIKAFVEDTPTEKDKDGAQQPAPEWPRQGRVVLTDVSCAYSDEKDAPLALQNISLTIEPGQKAIVVGRTGSGKSSLLLMLLNCLHHTGGIEIDGIDVTDLTHDGLRQAITTISQETMNLPGNMKNNLMPEGYLGSREIDDKELWSVLELVKLSDHITKNGGLEVPISDMHFSVGQRQLFGIARAIVHQRSTQGKLILMDEVTSSMDYETDAIIQKVMDTEFTSCTRIIVSHRQRNSDKYDVVVSLEDGKLIALETWAERNQASTSEILS